MANYTYPTNVTRFYEFMQWTNSVTNEWFGNVVLIMTFSVIFISVFSGQRNVNVSLMTASFLTSIFAILFRLAGMVSDFVMVICILVAGISYLILNYNQ